MDYRQVLDLATEAVNGLKGHTIDVITVKRPSSLQGAIELSKIISKLSPIIGNLLEFKIVEYLNENQTWPDGCQWLRQDPGFPDTVLSGMANPQPGIEVKTWFPLSTEITARFRDSQNHFKHNQTKVAILCWLPEFIIAGQPKIIDIWIGDAIDVAKARDNHYHNLPYYIVREPEDTSERTKNLQQTNCNGLKMQETSIAEAEAFVKNWGADGKKYSPDATYQEKLRELSSRFPYRLDTNFAKIDRIGLESIENFKTRVLNTKYAGRTVQSWLKTIADASEIEVSQGGIKWGKHFDKTALEMLVERQ